MRTKEEVKADIITCLKKHPNGVRLRYLPCGRMEGIEILEEMRDAGEVIALDIRHPEQMEWYYLWKLVKNGG